MAVFFYCGFSSSAAQKVYVIIRHLYKYGPIVQGWALRQIDQKYLKISESCCRRMEMQLRK